MSLRPNLPQPTQSVSAWPSTSPSSITRFWTLQIVLAILPSKHSTMPSLNSILYPRSHTVTAPSSCNCSETTLPSGPPQIAASQRLHQPLRHPRKPRRLLSPRRLRRPRRLSMSLPLPPPPNPRSLTLIPPSHFHMLLDLARVAGIKRLTWWSHCSLGRGWELIWKADECGFANPCDRFANTPFCEQLLMIMFFSFLVAIFTTLLRSLLSLRQWMLFCGWGLQIAFWSGRLWSWNGMAFIHNELRRHHACVSRGIRSCQGVTRNRSLLFCKAWVGDGVYAHGCCVIIADR